MGLGVRMYLPWKHRQRCGGHVGLSFSWEHTHHRQGKLLQSHAPVPELAQLAQARAVPEGFALRRTCTPATRGLAHLSGSYLVLVDSRAGAQQQEGERGALQLFTHLPQEVAEGATCSTGGGPSAQGPLPTCPQPSSPRTHLSAS